MKFQYKRVKGGYQVLGGFWPVRCAALPSRHHFRKVISVGRLTPGVECLMLPRTIVRIEEGAFEGHEDLERIFVPCSLQSMGRRAFKDCKKLKIFEAAHTCLQVVGAHCFEGCKELEKVDLPDIVSSIGPCALKNCSSLKTFRNPLCNRVLEEETLAGCSSLTDVFVQEYVSIANGAIPSMEGVM